MIRVTSTNSWFSGQPARPTGSRFAIGNRFTRQLCRIIGTASLGAILAACQIQTQSTQTTVPVAVVSDDVSVTRAGLDILSQGGNAADAATAMALAATVHSPDLAGLGGGGSCLAFDPEGATGEQVSAIDFPPRATAGGGAVPGTVRGLQLLQARFGDMRWAQTVAPAETAARVNETTSGAPSDLARTFTEIRTSGAAGFYNGALARRFAEGATAAGYAMQVGELRAYSPAEATAPLIEVGNERLALGPVLGGRGQALAAAIQGGGSVTGAAAPSFSLAATDANGGAVVCGLTMNQTGGTGVVAGGTGIVIAPANPQGGAAPAGLALRYNPFLNVALDALAVSGSPAALPGLVRQGTGGMQEARAAVAAAPVPATAVYCGMSDSQIAGCITAPSNRPGADGRVILVDAPGVDQIIGIGRN